MKHLHAPVETWPRSLKELLDSEPGSLKRPVVFRHADSTQDVARRMDAKPGDVIVTWRQTSGRGRLGRAWADTGEHGVALTAVVERDRPERLAIAAAVAVARAVEDLQGGRAADAVHIKWPNDVLVRGRKIAGVLIEQCDERAFIGIGVNVLQNDWPHDLEQSAISLLQAGSQRDRLHVLYAIIIRLQYALALTDSELEREFAQRDALAGQHVALRSGSREIEGTIVRVDPMRGLAVMTENDQEIWLPAATTTLRRN